jgi:hypothetical protein
MKFFTATSVVVTMGALCLTVLFSYAGMSLVQEPTCPQGMTHVVNATTFTCVDTYEASPAAVCLAKNVTSHLDTTNNVTHNECYAVSIEGVLPWRFISREEAQLMCARAGKRLPSATEWYAFSIGTVPQDCNVQSGIAETGKYQECVSAAGIVDVLGNVWEWVDTDVYNGIYNNQPLPQSGYIAQVNSAGIATVTTRDQATSSMGYIWTAQDAVSGIVRGGFYGIKSDAGVYTTKADISPNFTGAGVGFRCVR